MTTILNGVDPGTQGIGVNSTTNRLTAGSYDAAGNRLKTGTGQTYGWDGIGMMQSLTGTGQDWVYIYTADDERIWMLNRAASPDLGVWTVRDLDGSVLRQWVETGDYASDGIPVGSHTWTHDRDLGLGSLRWKFRRSGEDAASKPRFARLRWAPHPQSLSPELDPALNEIAPGRGRPAHPADRSGSHSGWQILSTGAARVAAPFSPARFRSKRDGVPGRRAGDEGPGEAGRTDFRSPSPSVPLPGTRSSSQRNRAGEREAHPPSGHGHVPRIRSGLGTPFALPPARMRLSFGHRFPRARVALRLLVLVSAGAFAAFLTYRVLFVYRIRVGACDVAAPEPERPPAFPAHPLLVLAWNIEGHASLINDDHLEGIAEVIRQLQPDLAILQEVHRGTWQARFRDQAAELARDTGMTVAFGPSLTIGRGEFGNAILARGRVESVEVHPLPAIGEPRSLLEVRIATERGTYAALATHLVTWGRLNRYSRAQQLDCVRERLARLDVPWVLAGDFNTTPEADEMEAFRGSVPLLEASPRAPTHRITQQQLDYVFASPGWTVGPSRVVDEGPSDHWPLLVRLEPPASALQGGS